MAGDEIDPFEIKGNLSVVAASDTAEFGDGSIDADGDINLNGTLGENTIGNGIIIRDLKNLTLKEQVAPSNPVASENIFYTEDSLLKSKDSFGVVTTYQPSNTKGDLVSHNGTTQDRLPLGDLNQVLIADPSESLGVRWKNISSGTVSDDNTNKYLNLTSSTSQAFIGTYTDILFDTNRKVDDFYSYDLNSQNIITINRDGKYCLFLRCAAFATNGNNASSSSIRIVKDSGTGYNEIDGSKAFMFHNSSTRGFDNCCVNSILDFNSGDSIKVQIKRDAGNSSLSTIQNATELVIVRVKIDQGNDTTKYFSVYNSNSQNITASFTDFALNTIRNIDSVYIYSTTTGVLEFTESGKYFITANVSTSTNSATETQSFFKFQKDIGSGYSNIIGSFGYIHNDSTPNSSSTGYTSFVLPVSVGDKIKMQKIIDSGAASASTIIGGCNFNVVKLESTLGQDTVKYFDSFSNTPVAISNVFTDIPLQSERIKDSIYTHPGGSSVLNINEDGRYLVLARVAYKKSSETTEATVKTRIVADTGGGFFELAGLETYSFHSTANTSVSQAIISSTIQFSAGSSIKLQGIITDGSNIETTGGSGLTILRLEPLSVSVSGLVAFGTEFNYVSSSSVSSSNSIAYVQKIRLTTDNIPQGTYRIGFYYIWSLDSTNRNFSIRVQIDDSLVIHEVTNSISQIDQDSSHSGFVIIPLSSGVHTIDLDFKVANNNTVATISNTRIEMWRIS